MGRCVGGGEALADTLDSSMGISTTPHTPPPHPPHLPLQSAVLGLGSWGIVTYCYVEPWGTEGAAAGFGLLSSWWLRRDLGRRGSMISENQDSSSCLHKFPAPGRPSEDLSYQKGILSGQLSKRGRAAFFLLWVPRAVSRDNHSIFLSAALSPPRAGGCLWAPVGEFSGLKP